MAARKSPGIWALPFLGGVPLDPRVVVAGDEGMPTVARDPGSPAAVAYREIARRVALEVARSNQAERGGVAESVRTESDAVVVRWHDGSEDRFGFEYLRNNCPCATCVDEWSGKRRSLTLLLPTNFAPRKLVPVGNYGVQIHWNDGHETGIYSHHLLRPARQTARRGSDARGLRYAVSGAQRRACGRSSAASGPGGVCFARLRRTMPAGGRRSGPAFPYRVGEPRWTSITPGTVCSRREMAPTSLAFCTATVT